MATWLHKKLENGEIDSVLIDPKSIKSYHLNGYVFDESGVCAPTQEEADTNNSGKLSSEEIREAAKKAGIEGYEKKRISTLKKELGYE